MEEGEPLTILHGARELERVTVDDYNAELRDENGFVGDSGHPARLSGHRRGPPPASARGGEGSAGRSPERELTKQVLDEVLAEGEPEAAGLIHGAIEAFTAELVTVIEELLRLPSWRDVQRIVVGGGLRGSRVGELVIGGASVRLKAGGRKLDVQPIHSDPDEAGLIGAVHLATDGVLGGHDGILAVDIGGSNVRAGVVGLVPRRNGRPPKGAVRELELWRYADEETRPTREETVEQIAGMLGRLAQSAQRHGLELAPFIGVACPGIISANGRIERGAQNLPGDWESRDFDLPARLAELGPRFGEAPPLVVLHNDAVVQGLSELPFLGGLGTGARSPSAPASATPPSPIERSQGSPPANSPESRILYQSTWWPGLWRVCQGRSLEANGRSLFERR